MGGAGMVGSARAASGRLVPMTMGAATGAHSTCLSVPVFELAQWMAGEVAGPAAR